MQSTANTVQYLKHCAFLTLSEREQLVIKQNGRPTPMMDITTLGKSRDKMYKRAFNPTFYKTTPWLCGCAETNRMFCFPCLLFGGDWAWANSGTSDLKHLPLKIRKHEQSAKHISSECELAMLGSVINSPPRQQSIQLRNTQVAKNREILSKVIDCVKCCGHFERALRGHGETEASKNSDIFQGLMELFSVLDSTMKSNFENSIIFKGSSKTIQNELLDCMLEACREQITEEINNAQFLAILVDEISDTSGKVQLIIVYRYELAGTAVERFWGCFNPKGQDADALSVCILSELNIHLRDTPSKLVAQCYNGGVYMSGFIDDIQKKVHDVYECACYSVHCYPHPLNLIMQCVSSQNAKASIFVSSLTAIAALFAGSPHRLEALHKIGSGKPESTTRWNFTTRTVKLVSENKSVLIDCFQSLSNDPKSSEATIRESAGILKTLNDPDFNFWLSFFHGVMPHVDLVHNQLREHQSKDFEVEAATDFIAAIQQIRDSAVIGTQAKINDDEYASIKRKKHSRVVAAREVCDVITKQTMDRFSFADLLDARKLVDSALFLQHLQKFPDEEFEATVKTYPVIQGEKLKIELTILYKRMEFREHKGAVQLLQLFLEHDLQVSFSETVTLLRILITTPKSSAEPEKCASTLKRAKTLLKNNVGKDRLCALAMLSIERNMIRGVPDFNRKVILKFAKLKHRRASFHLR